MRKSKKELSSLIISKTLIFIVVVLLIGSFKSIFGAENSLLGVTSVVLMLVLIQMDLTVHPIINLIALILFNLTLGLSSFLVVQNPFIGLVINFMVMSFIGYYFSYELKKPVNMMIGLHYILLITNPVTPDQLSTRLIALVFGAFMIMSVQLLANRNKLVKSRKKILSAISDSLLLKIDLIKSNKSNTDVDIELEYYINQIKSCIFSSGKSSSIITECGRNTLSIVSCLEKFNCILENMKNTSLDFEILEKMSYIIKCVKDENFDNEISFHNINTEYTIDMYDFINLVKTLKIEMEIYTNTDTKSSYLKTGFSIPKELRQINMLKNRFKLESNRVSYGIRLGLVVSITYFIVSFFNINFGEWAVYTVFALSQPHLEYTLYKSKKRIVGTIFGSIIIAILFNIVTDSNIRTLILLTAGYLMSYVSDYRNIVLFSTIAAIASASISIINPDPIIFNRVVFVIIGIFIALIANKFILPRTLFDEEENLNNMQIQSCKKMMSELLLGTSAENESLMNIVALVPSLIDLRVDYLKQNGLKVDKSFINHNKALMNELYQLHLLCKYNNDYQNVFYKINNSIYSSDNLYHLENILQKNIISTDNLKEQFLFKKILNLLHLLNKIDTTPKYDTNLKVLAAFN